MKLPGLRRYLSQSLGYEIEKLDSFRNLTGSQVASAPSFQENLLSFPVAYGLAVQGLAKGAVHTNLLPKEITYDRLVKRKKPWAVAAAALLLLGCSVSFAAYSMALRTVDAESWKEAENQADGLVKEAGDLKSRADQARGEYEGIRQIGQNLVGNVEGRIRWLELLKAINACLPSDPPEGENAAAPTTESISRRRELHITSLECQSLEDVSTWYTRVKQWDGVLADAGGKPPGEAGAAAGQATATPAPDANNAAGAAAAEGPKGPGWIVRLTGYHYHNVGQKDYGGKFIYNTLIENLRNMKVGLPSGEGGAIEEVGMRELGISYPVLIDPRRREPVKLTNPNADGADASPQAAAGEHGMVGMLGGVMRPKQPVDGEKPVAAASVPRTIELEQFNFAVEFCLQYKSPTERHEAKKAKEKEQAGGATQPAQP
jgi:type IV pilus assembly protein PilM